MFTPKFFLQKLYQLKEERDRILQKMDEGLTPLENQRVELVRQLEIVDQQLNDRNFENSNKKLSQSTSMDETNSFDNDFKPSCPPPYSP